MKRHLIILFLLSSRFSFSQQKNIVPSKQQLQWSDMEIGVLIHFDMPVFKPDYVWNRDFGKHPDASVFNPTQLDTDQWILAARASGAKYAVLVAKHCSGFSLWPTQAHEYSIKNSPWKNGKGDIVKDFIASCKKYGLKPGIYASTGANGYLQVNNPAATLTKDTAKRNFYNGILKKQLTELYSQYGSLFEIWFDGGVVPVKNGGPDVLSLLKKYQSGAIAFQGPADYDNNIRWVGNEEGVAPYPCWARTDTTISANGMVEIKKLNGSPNGLFWCPGEADFPLRRTNTFQGGWFWHEGDDDKLYSMGELMDKYTKSVGRNTNMLLGMVVDNRGMVPEADVKRLRDFGNEIKKKYGKPLAKTSGTGRTYIIKPGHSARPHAIVIMEDISLGEKVLSYEISGLKDGEWEKLATGTSIGHKRIELISGDYASFKLGITNSAGIPHIKEFACY